MHKWLSCVTILVMVGVTLDFSVAGEIKRQDFVVIQPGQPGSRDEAQPVMDSIGEYIEKKMPSPTRVEGKYFNTLESALQYLQQGKAKWGIVSLPFYSAYSRCFNMTPLASTRPGGAEKDLWRLAVYQTATDDWQKLQGKIQGTMLFDGKTAMWLLTDKKTPQTSFQSEGTFRPLRAVRKVTRNKLAGVVLDQLQYGAILALPLFKELKIVYTSPPLPTSPLVWFGPDDDSSEVLKNIIMNMANDPEAEDLLNLLQTDGFGPADNNLKTLELPCRTYHDESSRSD